MTDTTIATRLARRAASERAAITHPAAKAVHLTGPQAHGLFVMANGRIDFETMMGSNVHKSVMWRALEAKGLVTLKVRAADPQHGVPEHIYNIEITEAGLALAVEIWCTPKTIDNDEG